MILLDTNVISAFMQAVPDPVVTKWLDLQPRDSIWTTSITVMELRSGIRAMPASRRRTALTQALATLVEEKIQGRIASFDVLAAESAAELNVLRKLRGRTIDFRDTMIAGIALATNATLCTRNVTHFSDLNVTVVNPWNTI
jgi:toxin FitB